jgi:hypothetical protein
VRLLELVALLAIAALIGWLLLRAAQAQSTRSARWQVAERTDQDGTVIVEVVRPGQHPRRVRALPPTLEADAFDWELAQARADAEAQAAALNVGRPTRR